MIVNKRWLNKKIILVKHWWNRFEYKKWVIVISTLVALILVVLLIRGALFSKKNKKIDKTDLQTAVLINTYFNREMGIKFQHSETTKIFSEERSTKGSSNRLLSVVLKDTSLVTSSRKDDELYFSIEVWRAGSNYPMKICDLTKKKTEAVKVGGLAAKRYSVTDNSGRIRKNICITRDDKSYLLMSSVSSKLGHETQVDNLVKKITDGFEWEVK